MRSHKGHMHYPTAFLGSVLWFAGLLLLGFELGWLKDFFTYDPDAWTHARIMCVGLILSGAGLSFVAAARRMDDPQMGFVWIGLLIAIMGPIATLGYYAMTQMHLF